MNLSLRPLNVRQKTNFNFLSILPRIVDLYLGTYTIILRRLPYSIAEFDTTKIYSSSLIKILRINLRINLRTTTHTNDIPMLIYVRGHNYVAC